MCRKITNYKTMKKVLKELIDLKDYADFMSDMSSKTFLYKELCRRIESINSGLDETQAVRQNEQTKKVCKCHPHIRTTVWDKGINYCLQCRLPTH